MSNRDRRQCPVGALLRLSGLAAFAVAGLAHATFVAPPVAPPPIVATPTQTCPDGAIIYVTDQCKPIPGVSQPGTTGATLTGAITSIGGTIGGVLGTAFSGSAQTASAGVTRSAFGGQTGAAAASGAPRWNAWAAYSNVDTGYSFQPLQSGGRVGIALAGIDYAFGDVIAGVAVSDERSRIDTSYNGGRIAGNGNSVSPYLGWQINRNWLLDATVGFGSTRLDSSDNSVAGGTTGSNKVERTMATLGVSYNQSFARWLLTARAGLLSVENRFSAFTFSNGTTVPGSTVTTGQARLGLQAAYNAGNVVPFVGLTYIYDYQHPAQGTVGGQTPANDRDAWQVRVGVNLRSAGALYGGIALSSDRGRSQVKNDQILFNVGLRF